MIFAGYTWIFFIHSLILYYEFILLCVGETPHPSRSYNIAISKAILLFSNIVYGLHTFSCSEWFFATFIFPTIALHTILSVIFVYCPKLHYRSMQYCHHRLRPQIPACQNGTNLTRNNNNTRVKHSFEIIGVRFRRMKSECLETEIILCKRQSHRKVFRSQISLCCPNKIDEKCHRHEHTSKLLSAVDDSHVLFKLFLCQNLSFENLEFV